PRLANPSSKKATKLMKTTYQARLHLAPNFQCLPVLLDRHTLHLFPYGTKQVSDVPTIADGKYTSHGYVPSNAYTYVQIVPVHSSLSCLHLFVVQSPDRPEVACLQTIVLINTVRQQPHFAQNDRLDEHGLQYGTRYLHLVNLLQFVYDIRSDPFLHIYLHFHSSFHLHS